MKRLGTQRTFRVGLDQLRTAALAVALGLVSAVGFAQARGDHAPGSHPIHAAQVEGAAPGAEHAAPHEGGAHAEHDESAPPEQINWATGFLGEKEGVEPGLLWRAPGTPPPYLAAVLNFVVFAVVIVRFGAKPVAEALTKRKQTIMKDIDEAQKMREASEKRLREYEARLAKIEEELERVRTEFREQGERERERIVREANERRERMKKEAEFLLAQELKQMRLDLLRETVDEAIRGAGDMLAKKLTSADQDRFAESFLTQLPARTGSIGAGESVAAKGGVS
jgi:F-type H+-transporting ATPase subunit b